MGNGHTFIRTNLHWEMGKSLLGKQNSWQNIPNPQFIIGRHYQEHFCFINKKYENKPSVLTFWGKIILSQPKHSQIGLNHQMVGEQPKIISQWLGKSFHKKKIISQTTSNSFP